MVVRNKIIASVCDVLLRSCTSSLYIDTNAAFTLNGFDDQVRTLTYVNTDFLVF